MSGVTLAVTPVLRAAQSGLRTDSTFAGAAICAGLISHRSLAGRFENPMPIVFSQELRWLIPRLKPHLRLHVQSFLALTLATFLSLGTPLAIRWLIDQVLRAHDLVLLTTAI